MEAVKTGDSWVRNKGLDHCGAVSLMGITICSSFPFSQVSQGWCPWVHMDSFTGSRLHYRRFMCLGIYWNSSHKEWYCKCRVGALCSALIWLISSAHIKDQNQPSPLVSAPSPLVSFPSTSAYVFSASFSLFDSSFLVPPHPPPIGMWLFMSFPGSFIKRKSSYFQLLQRYLAAVSCACVLSHFSHVWLCATV